MVAASIVAIAMRVNLDWHVIKWGTAGGCAGMLLWVFVPDVLPTRWLAVVFASLWCGFAFSLALSFKVHLAAAAAELLHSSARLLTKAHPWCVCFHYATQRWRCR